MLRLPIHIRFLLSYIIFVGLVGCATTAENGAFNLNESKSEDASFRLERVVQLDYEPDLISYANGGDKLYFISMDGRQYGTINKTGNVEAYSASCAPTAFSLSHKNTEIYIACASSNDESGALLRYSTSTHKLLGAIKFTADFFCASISISQDDSIIFLTDVNGIYVYAIDSASFSVIRRIALKRSGGWRSLLSPAGDRLYVLHPGTHSISVVKTSDFSIIDEILEAGLVPTSLALSKDGKVLYTASNDAPSLTMIDTTIFKTSFLNLQERSLFLRKREVTPFYNPDIYVVGKHHLYLWYPHISTLYIVNALTKNALPVIFKENVEASSMAVVGSGNALALTNKKGRVYFYENIHNTGGDEN